MRCLTAIVVLLELSAARSLSLTDRRTVLGRAIHGAVGGAVSGAALLSPASSSAATAAESGDCQSIGPISVPKVGYSLYKTDASQVEACIELALAAGVRHFDCASQYGTNEMVGTALAESRTKRTELCIAHKVSNDEQSTDKRKVKRAVQREMSRLGPDYLDIAMVHSPPTDAKRRIQTYRALLELQEKGLVKAVGVCNYGVSPLEEIVKAGLPPPSVIQLSRYLFWAFQNHDANAATSSRASP